MDILFDITEMIEEAATAIIKTEIIPPAQYVTVSINFERREFIALINRNDVAVLSFLPE
jgi:hypothetical protein